MDTGKLDPVTGRATTGHVWNGIEELETPIPRVVLLFLSLAVVFSLVCWFLLPTWPLGWTYTRGLLGIDQRDTVTRQVEKAAAERAVGWADRVQAMDYADIEADKDLMAVVKEAGHPLFADNCAVCHGVKGTGGPGFPDLAAKAWLWGGDPETIAETITVGINSTNEDTRTAQMPAFGRDGMLERDRIIEVAAYVHSLSNPGEAGADAARIAAGKEVFAENCSACHGEDGKGSTDVGAPDLTDAHWIYGGSEQTIYTTIYSGRAGHMPNWGGRLSPLQVKLLALYVRSLEGEKR